MMKILMPVLHYPPVIGGLETWTRNIAERFSGKAEIFVVTGKVENQPKEEIKNGVRIRRTSLFVLKNLSYSSPVYIFTALPFIFLKSLELLKKEKINLLHCQGFLSGFLGYLFFKLFKVPYIATVQRLENKNRIKELVYKNAKVCVAASSAIKKYFEEIGCKNIEVIPNGIDLERFGNLDRQKSREKLGIKDEFVIMTAARLEKVKGINYLIEAAKFLIPSFALRASAGKQNSKFIILIIGDGSERKNLEESVKKLNLEEKIRFLGQIPNEEIPEYLIAGDCFVLPSLKEGFGIAILEAIAVGLPVIATNVGGIPDIIKDGENGILVEPKNPKAIAEAAFKIYSRPSLREKLTASAREKLPRYDWGAIAESVFKIYQKTIL